MRTRDLGLNLSFDLRVGVRIGAHTLDSVLTLTLPLPQSSPGRVGIHKTQSPKEKTWLGRRDLGRGEH